MTLQTTKTPRPFTPLQEAPADLDKRTVGRTDILVTLAQRLEAAAMSKARPHTLLVGPRGSGKTHLLRVALHRLAQAPDVSTRLTVADIPEDAVGITRYVDLLREIGAALQLKLPRQSSAVELETAILESIQDRTLVIVIENLDRVFAAIGHGGQRNLRSWVETSGRILLLCATPALFAGVADRNQPWFAGFITTPVEGLTAEAGHELLTILARQRGDEELAEFLETATGRARVEAVARLTGGSARIWMVLSGCMTIASLDALIPAVEDLIEGLVPYYQQLLWDLPPNHQAVVRQLAEGPTAAMTAAQIASATELSQQTVSKVLGLLQEGRWVGTEKLAGDRRKTWYSLREPMLRHHFQWRSTRSQPLELIVELLRAWYDPQELKMHLATIDAQSPAERYLLESLSSAPILFDEAYATRSKQTLLAEARRWMTGASDVYTVDCGRYVETCVTLAANADLDVQAHLAARKPAGAEDRQVAVALSEGGSDDLAEILQRAASAASGDTRAGIALVASGWWSHDDTDKAYRLLAAIPLASITSPATAMALQIEANYWLSKTGRVSDALKAVTSLMPQLLELGADHPVTLTARSNIAYYTGKTGDEATALSLYQSLVEDYLRTVGPDNIAALAARAQVAYYTGATGDASTALILYRDVFDDERRTLGVHHPNTLATHAQLAYFTGEDGDATTALSIYQDVLAEHVRVFGADHPNTLAVRAQVAYYTGATGDATTALSLYQNLVDDHVRVLGTDHPHTLTVRAQVAYCRIEMGDLSQALALYRDLLDDRIRVLGVEHPKTSETRRSFAIALARADELDEAIALLANEKDVAETLTYVLLEAPTPPSGDTLFTLLWRGFRGDPEATAQLPVELRDMTARIAKEFSARARTQAP
ncbi:tetratricopeptide repeat protein [Mycobacterium kyogaense]|uniref:tetratricopeptide repeat protein n=1 Tax=Mycobacterium kyogaense TaxID=2212479 RepID=UPI000DAE3D53|nr:tetratricopeptide repeat protein [Mycobacterium kyogaense]